MEEKKLMEEYIKKRKEIDDMEEMLKEEKERLSEISNKIINYLSDRGQTKTGTYAGIGSISIKSFNTYKIDEENKDKLFKFLEENNINGVIRQTIHHKTLDKICNELIEEGMALPDYINAYNVTTIQLNKG